MASDDHLIAALKRERAGYVARGESDRVAQVDEQLRLHGHNPEATTPGEDGPNGRTQPPQQSADTAVPRQSGGVGKAPAKKTAAKKTAAATPKPE